MAAAKNKIDEAINLYPSDKNTSIEIIINIYEEQKNLQYIKSSLLAKQSYNLYIDFIRELPLSQETALEILNMTILTRDANRFSNDVINYLNYYSAQSFADNYAEPIIEWDFTYQLLKMLDNPDIFYILEKSYIKRGKVEDFDRILIKEDYVNKLDKNKVKNYLADSWIIKQRDIKNIALTYSLEGDALINQYLIASDFISGNYNEIISKNESFPLINEKSEPYQKVYHIDMPYILSYSYFKEGNLKKALEWSDKIYFPAEHNIAELRFLCHMESDENNAKKELNRIKDSDSKVFYQGFMKLLKNDTNGMIELEKYFNYPEQYHRFMLEALLLTFTYYKNSPSFSNTVELVKDSMLNQKPSSYEDNPISYAYSVEKEIINSNYTSTIIQDGSIKDFIEYKQAVFLLKEEKKEDAKKIFLSLIKRMDTSPVIKSLAIYEMRKL